MITDPQQLDCPPCKADDFELCNHTEPQREMFRAARAQRNREKKKRSKANARRDARNALMSGDRWV